MNATPQRRGARRIIAAVGATAALLGLLGGPASAAEKKPLKPLTETRISEQTKPGTVLIVNESTAQITLPKGKFNTDLFIELLRTDPSLIELIRVGRVNDAINAGIEKYVAVAPTKFFTLVGNRQLEGNAVFTGSGAVVTPDGYIVTNAHVAAVDEDSLEDAMIQDALPTLDKDIDEMSQTFDDVQLSETNQKTLRDAYIKFVAQGFRIAGLESQVFVLQGVANPAERKAKGSQAEVVEAGKGYPDKDVAVLKIQAQDLYTIPVGDDGDVNSGNKIYVVGYPGAATFRGGTDQESLLEASLSAGNVSARKTVPAGFSAIQHTATTQGGSSGGPIVNEYGQLIGIHAATTGGENEGKFQFGIPGGVVREFLQRKNVTPIAGPVTTQYLKALEEFDRQHYKKSAKILESLNQSHPGRPYITDKLAAATKRFPEDKGESSNLGLVAAAGGGLLALLLLGGGVGFAVSRGKKKKGGGDLAAVTPYAAGTPMPPSYGPADQYPPGTPPAYGGQAPAGLPGAPQAPASEPPAYSPPPSSPGSYQAPVSAPPAGGWEQPASQPPPVSAPPAGGWEQPASQPPPAAPSAPPPGSYGTPPPAEPSHGGFQPPQQ